MMDFYEWNPFWATCFSVMAFLIIVGNSLTIATLLRKKFRKRPQFLLINLAFADLLVGCATVLYVIVQFGFIALWFVLDIFDMFAGLSSIFHLAVISLERLHATVRPFRHRQLSLKPYWVAIATPWVLSSSVATLMLTRFRGMLHAGVPLIIVIICLTTPLLITCFSYLAIWRKRRISPENVRSFRQNQEARFSKSIFLVTAASFLTWTPFLVAYIIVLVTVYLRFPLFVIFCIVLVHFSNSFVNFIIHIIRFPSYRKALFSLCRCSVL
ncbi:medium-wave-sensitive opsin 1-like [Acropora millepora]|uniref:medium-wave-sensitive opsin 1-like n=1 Tax=Acropora millepora TaxID=45264 RepID=UPI001CF3661D|nr:medium-wave-sensitive opsin 1-like [Acropora millepora]